MASNFSLSSIIYLATLGYSYGVNAADYPLPAENSRLIGAVKHIIVPNDDGSLEMIAAKYDIGLLAMLEANPRVDPFLPEAGSRLTLPTQMILPDTPREGIVVNLAELRLYYYPKDENRVVVYPIGIGQIGQDTPEMITRISQKISNPTWTPTKNIRQRYAENGIELPAVMPAGPDNPMGDYALRLAKGYGQYLIHGTNANFGIGMRVSAGCIRLRPNDIEALFNQVPYGTRVEVINQPIKVTVEPNGYRYVEVHQPLSKEEDDDPQTMAIAFNQNVTDFLNHPLTNSLSFSNEVIRRSGIPINVTSDIPLLHSVKEQIVSSGPISAKNEVVTLDEITPTKLAN